MVAPPCVQDVTFHQCVNLGRFNTEKVVSFVPPDGEFELMKYRCQEGISLPFKVGNVRLLQAVLLHSPARQHLSLTCLHHVDTRACFAFTKRFQRSSGLRRCWVLARYRCPSSPLLKRRAPCPRKTSCSFSSPIMVRSSGEGLQSQKSGLLMPCGRRCLRLRGQVTTLVNELGRTRLEVNVKVKAEFGEEPVRAQRGRHHTRARDHRARPSVQTNVGAPPPPPPPARLPPFSSFRTLLRAHQVSAVVGVSSPVQDASWQGTPSAASACMRSSSSMRLRRSLSGTAWGFQIGA